MRLCYAIVVSSGVCFPCLSHACEPTAVERLEELITRDYHPAIDSDVFERYDALFANASQSSLAALKRHRNPSIAVRAAWEEVRRAMDDGENNVGKKIDAPSLQRFLGFVEGRLRAHIPDSWQAAFFFSRYVSRETFYVDYSFDGADSEQVLGERSAWRVAGVQVNSRHPIRQDGNSSDVLVSVFGVWYAIPTSALLSSVDRLGELVNLVAVPISKHKVVVAVYSCLSSTYRLYGVDSNKHEIAWSRDVWCADPHGGGSGIVFHELAPILEGKSLYLFGVCTDAIYAEAFSVDDGAVLLRFGTAY
ncbi:MAG: hypothetical protein K1X74_07130 [Pirellulales bacterium]|nr:hypothetical protein [Pirellulales bacterium]